MAIIPVVAGYIRVSSARQRDESDSPASQRQRLEAAGCTRIYQDLAVSGYRLSQRRKAVEFQQLITDITEGRVQRLVAVRLDRLARRDQIVLELAELCHRHGVELGTLSGGRVDVSTASGWLQLKVNALFGEHYSRSLGEAVRAGYAGLHAHGIPARSAAGLPFHLQRQPGTRHGVEPSAQWDRARHAAEQFICGWSIYQVGVYLHRTCGRTGDSKTTRRWLRSAALAGHMDNAKGEILVRDCWPALVNEAERQQILARLDETRRRRSPRDGRTRLLSGICRCALCGASLSHEQVRRRERRYDYLRCVRIGCNRTTIAMGPVWEAITEHLDSHLEELVRLRAEAAAVRTEPAEVTSWRRELAARQALPADLLQPSDRRRMTELQGLIAAADAVPQVAEDWWPDGLGAGSVQFWTQRPEAEINRDLRRLIAAVPVDPGTNAVGEPVWRT
jgi:DNA invertase Pin-like site-specific DNA recombinase